MFALSSRFFSKGIKAMRANVARCVLVILTAVVLSGCYSDGRWSAPNLAFWKSSPFQSTPSATPGAVGSPVKPSGIAAAGKSNTTTPSVSVASTGGSTTPSATPTGLATGYNTPATGYNCAQYRLPDGPIFFGHDARPAPRVDLAVGLRADELHGQHGRSARGQCIPGIADGRGGHQWALWSDRRGRRLAALQRHEFLCQPGLVFL